MIKVENLIVLKFKSYSINWFFNWFIYQKIISGLITLIETHWINCALMICKEYFNEKEKLVKKVLKSLSNWHLKELIYKIIA